MHTNGLDRRVYFAHSANDVGDWHLTGAGAD